MKKKFLKLFAICGLSVFSFSLQAQLDGVTQVLKGGADDAEKLVSAYMSPYGKAFALDLSNGWYNTAQPHSLFGFDLTFTLTGVSIPTSDLTFDVSKLNLSSKLSAGTPSISPTIAGAKSGGGNIVLELDPNVPNKTIQLPVGIGVSFVPAVMLQLGFGLPFKTEIMGRYLPTIGNDKFGKLGMWGIGFKHDIKQWIPIVSATPFWSLSALVGYTKFKTSATGSYLAPDPTNYYMDDVNLDDYKNQGVELNASALNISLLASTNIPVINVYGGIGFVKTSSNLVLKGKYPFPVLKPADIAADGSNAKFRANNIQDPINADLSSGTNFKATIGLRLKLALLTIHGDVSTAGGYTSYTAGMGISFR